MFAVMGNFEARDADRTEAMNKRREGAVAFAGEFDWLVLAQQSCAASDASIVAFCLKTLECPRRVSFDVFAPEHRFEFRAADFAAKAIDFIVRDRTKLTPVSYT